MRPKYLELFKELPRPHQISLLKKANELMVISLTVSLEGELADLIQLLRDLDKHLASDKSIVPTPNEEAFCYSITVHHREWSKDTDCSEWDVFVDSLAEIRRSGPQ